MERLTEWIGTGDSRKALARQDRRDIGDKDCIARLAAYEDTGLTPKEIMDLIPPPNGPLTLEELREMNGEPVWISYLNSAKGKYHIVRAFGKNSIIFEEYDKEFGPYKSLFLGFYGKNWLSYRRKPEEGTE